MRVQSIQRIVKFPHRGKVIDRRRFSLRGPFRPLEIALRSSGTKTPTHQKMERFGQALFNPSSFQKEWLLETLSSSAQESPFHCSAQFIVHYIFDGREKAEEFLNQCVKSKSLKVGSRWFQKMKWLVYRMPFRSRSVFPGTKVNPKCLFEYFDPNLQRYDAGKFFAVCDLLERLRLSHQMDQYPKFAEDGFVSLQRGPLVKSPKIDQSLLQGQVLEWGFVQYDLINDLDAAIAGINRRLFTLGSPRIFHLEFKDIDFDEDSFWFRLVLPKEFERTKDKRTDVIQIVVPNSEGFLPGQICKCFSGVYLISREHVQKHFQDLVDRGRTRSKRESYRFDVDYLIQNQFTKNCLDFDSYPEGFLSVLKKGESVRAEILRNLPASIRAMPDRWLISQLEDLTFALGIWQHIIRLKEEGTKDTRVIKAMAFLVYFLQQLDQAPESELPCKSVSFIPSMAILAFSKNQMNTITFSFPNSLNQFIDEMRRTMERTILEVDACIVRNANAFYTIQDTEKLDTQEDGHERLDLVLMSQEKKLRIQFPNMEKSTYSMIAWSYVFKKMLRTGKSLRKDGSPAIFENLNMELKTTIRDMQTNMLDIIRHYLAESSEDLPASQRLRSTDFPIAGKGTFPALMNWLGQKIKVT